MYDSLCVHVWLSVCVCVCVCVCGEEKTHYKNKHTVEMMHKACPVISSPLGSCVAGSPIPLS